MFLSRRKQCALVFHTIASAGSPPPGEGGKMAKRALVAGAAGFIGSHLCDLLLSKGYEVTGVDSLITGRRKNIERAAASGLKLVEWDIQKPLMMDDRFDEIYNLA